MRIERIDETLKQGNLVFWAAVGIVFVASLGLVNYLTYSMIGNQILFPFFYLVPIVLVTWSGNESLGLSASVLSALAWLIAESATDSNHSLPAVYFWNTLIQIGFFVLVTHLVAELQKSRRDELLAAHTDFVTGAVNARYFSELLRMEVERIRRYPHPITVVYIDLDDFKQVNDLFGHKIGDEVLRYIASELKSQLRSTDVIARLGGDEFAVLLPATHQTEAQVVMPKVHTHLTEAMRQKNWPVTLSMGAVTYVYPPYSVEQLIATADQLMYEVKNSTKNAIRFDTWTGGYFESDEKSELQDSLILVGQD